MIRRAVIALAIVFPDELPVALLDDGILHRDAGVSETVRADVGLKLLAHRREVGRLGGNAHEDIAGHGFAVNASQGVGCAVELRSHEPCREQAPVQ